MLISYQWLTELLGQRPDVRELARRLTFAGLEVEGVRHVGANLRPVTVAAVVSSRPHPTSKNALTLVTVDAGEELGTLELVCGAPNVPPPGGRVCLAPIGTELFDKKGERFTLVEKPVAGVVSRGMLCAEDELGLGNDHAGILVLDEGRPGNSLLDLYPALEDWVLTLNVTANRPDALGHLGVAREVATLFGLPFALPSPAAPTRVRAAGAGERVTVKLEDPAGCPRYDAAVLADVAVGPSPLTVRARLQRLGVRAISNVVDVTNLVMLEYGQPLHAFDLAQVDAQTIVVRRAEVGEAIQTLDGVQRTLDADDLIIADPRRALAIAGVMGGEGSGVTSATRTVLLEAAFFEPRGVRRSARRHGIHSEASHRFEREVDVTAVPRALARAVELLAQLAGATSVGEPVDAYPTPRVAPVLTVRRARIEQLLGIPAPERSGAILASLGFVVRDPNAEPITVEVPAHRPDVTAEIDLVEEIARVHGYDKIPSRLPPTAGTRAGATRDFWLRRRLRDVGAAIGLVEAVSYAFIAPREIEAVGLDPAAGVRIANPLSLERSIMRPSLLPRLLAAAAHAHRYNVPRIRLFEVGTVFEGREPDEPGLARETTRFAIVMAGPRDAWLAREGDVDFFDGKGVVEALVGAMCNLEPGFERDDAPPWAHPRRFAHVTIAGAGRIGTVAELHPDVRDALGLPRAVVVADLDAAPLGAIRRRSEARAPGRFPSVRRDVALQVSQTHAAGAIAEALRAAAGAACERVELFDRYEGQGLPPGTHSLAYALHFRSDERTLTDEEVDGWTRAALARATSEFDAKQR